MQNENKKEAIVDFDRAFCGHVSYMLGNITGSFWQAITGGRFASSPVEHDAKRWYQQLHRYSQNFALVGDWTVVLLGGDLKRKQRLSGRMADILSDLYLLSTTLKRYEDEGCIKEDLPVVDAIARDRILAIENSFRAVFDNFPNRFVAFVMRMLVFPFGQRATGSGDRENYKLARQILNPGEQRDRYTMGVYISHDPEDITGVLEDALVKVARVAEIEHKFIRALKKGRIMRRQDRDAIEDAVAEGVLSEDEAKLLRIADEATDRVVAVDDFDSSELGMINRVNKPQVVAAAE